MNKKILRQAHQTFSSARRNYMSNMGVLALTCGAGLTPACSRDPLSTSGNQAERAQLSTLAILPPTSLTLAPEMFADAANYFADQQLEVMVDITRGSPQAIQLVLAGRAGLTRISQIEGMRAAANRMAPLVNVGTVFKGSTIRYVSNERTPLREPKDFIGKIVGIPAAGGSSDLELDLFLAIAGVDRSSVQRQVVGLTPAVFSLVDEGRIAGYAVSIDTAKILQRQHLGVVVLNPGSFMSSGGQFYMTSGSGLEQNRDGIKRYIEAIHAALLFMIDDDGFDKTLEILRTKYSFDALNDNDIAKASLEEYRDVWNNRGRENLLLTSQKEWAEGYKELVQAELAESGHIPERWFTNQFVPQTTTIA